MASVPCGTSQQAPTPPAPPGWKVTDAPMTIAFLGWGRLGAQGREGSGYNLSASELASGLALSGHRVVYLRSGMDYALRPGMFIRKFEQWRGVDCFHLFNSPNLSPAVFNFTNMAREMACPKQTALVLGWLDRVGAQTVHIHSLEGFSLDLVGAIRATGRPVVITTHNYWHICPQVDLLHSDRLLCMDYEGGRRCESCVHPATPLRARIRRRIEQTARRAFGRNALPIVQSVLNGNVIPRGVKRLVNGDGPEHQDQPIDPELAQGFSDIAPAPDGLQGPVFPLDPSEQLPEPPPALPGDTNERFLRADHHLTVINDYGKRRMLGLDALRAASLVTPPSSFMLDVYASMGVPRERLRHVRLGQPHFDAINRRARRGAYYNARPWDPADSRRPLRIAFFGTVRHNKGLEVFARAIETMEPALRRRCHFLIRAGGGDWNLRRRLSRVPEASFLGAYDPLHLLSAAGEYDIGVLPHIWFENSPLVMLEFLHAGKFVIASKLGGPPSWICEPGSARAEANGGLGNGLLTPGADAPALARAIERVVGGDVVVPSPAEIHAVSELRSYPEHVREVEMIHRDLLDAR